MCRAASPEDLAGWVEALGQVGEGVRSNSSRCAGRGIAALQKEQHKEQQEQGQGQEEREIEWL